MNSQAADPGQQNNLRLMPSGTGLRADKLIK
jgi:hypothetical protein